MSLWLHGLGLVTLLGTIFFSPFLFPSSLMLKIVRDCISQIYEGEDVYETSNYTTSELDDFVMSLRSKDLLKIQGFFEDLPRVYADIKYTNRAGEEKEIRLEGMQSFFA